MAATCPGMNPANWKIEDIFETACPACGELIEFWKDDVKRRCGCGHICFNPRLGNLCLSWCEKAEECLGNQDIAEWKQKRANEAPGQAREP
jgi:hypothetical protein